MPGVRYISPAKKKNHNSKEFTLLQRKLLHGSERTQGGKGDCGKAPHWLRCSLVYQVLSRALASYPR